MTLQQRIPKGTLAYWFRKTELSQRVKDRMRTRALQALAEARMKSNLFYRKRRREQWKMAITDNQKLLNVREIKAAAKAVLCILFAAEGSRNIKRACVIFGNSDPEIIQLFLRLLRTCYQLDEKKLRCTVQHRADQDPAKLAKYWTKVTGIPISQFHKALMDPRTIGKPTERKTYMGVCRITYFSARILLDLVAGSKVLTQGP